MSPYRVCSRFLIVLILIEPARAVAQTETAAQLQAKIYRLEGELQRLRIEFALAGGKEKFVPPILQTQLEEEFRAMVKDDRARDALEKVARDSGRFREDIIRKNRSPAAIPLLLKWLHERPSDDDLTTLAILTGEDVASIYKSGGAEALVTKWWVPRKKAIRVDLKLMNREQLTHVLNTLLENVEADDRSRGLHREFSAASVQNLFLNATRSMSAEIIRPWYDEEIVAGMLPMLLDQAGLRRDVAADQPANYAIIPMLATLRKNGEAAELDKILRDETQSGATRLICLHALAQAGENPPTAAVLDIYKKAKSLDMRVAAIRTLSWSKDPAQGAEQLVTALDDPNFHIRTAAVSALGSISAPAAVPKLIKMLDERVRVEKRASDRSRLSAFDGHPGSKSILNAIAEAGSREALHFVAARLEKLVDQKSDLNYLRDTLVAFESLTGMSWLPSFFEEPQDRAAAERALEWWKGQNK